MIRKARAQDFPSAFEFAGKAKESTIYTGVDLDKPTCFKLWTRSVMDSRMFNWVIEADGEIHGFLIGAVAPLEFNDHEYYATDIFYLVEEGHRGAVTLLAEFTKWAASIPRVRMVIMGVTSGDGKDMGPLYERFSLRRVGGLYANNEVH